MDYNINMNKEVIDVKFLVDTNICIYATDGLIDLDQFCQAGAAISFVTKIELLGKKDVDANELRSLLQTMLRFRVVKISDTIINMAIKIKQHRIVKVPDAIIAATAIVKNLTLVTADVKLAKVDGLKVLLVQPEIINT
jgi:predicted nucleic acid-binding protein